MARTQKWYVVWVGKQPGVYATWAECLEQVSNYPNARYRSFPSEQDAKQALEDGADTRLSGKTSCAGKAIQESLSVDAACSGNPGVMEYRGVYTKTHVEIFHIGPFPLGTNNIGEFLAIVHALAFLKKSGRPKFPIYTDSETALSWLRNKRCKTLLPRNEKTEKLFQLIERAEKWLSNNPITNPLIKWDTKKWGEIPADFGRK